MLQRIRHKLRQWYATSHRDLPWRRTQDPYAIWISEVMLQQTRAVAVVPYYEAFLLRFPTIAALAAAPEQDVLAAWSGLGYYSRARNLQKAARQMHGVFPAGYHSIRALAGVGDYTAAAVASIAFNLPHAVLDGNVLRVLARLTNDGGDIGSSIVRRRLQQVADALLDTRVPGEFNQAMMELGATICLPKQPQCLLCPVVQECEGFQSGRQTELPLKIRRVTQVKLERMLLLVRKNEKVLMWRRPQESRKLAGFWELPEPNHLPDASIGHAIGEFRHSITNHDYTVRVFAAMTQLKPLSFEWIDTDDLRKLPLSTTTRKALALSASKL